LNAFPLPNGPQILSGGQPTGMAQFVAAFSTAGRLDATSLRLDHSFSSRFTFFGRYSDSPSRSESRLVNNLANPIPTSTKIKTLTIGTSNVFTPHVTNEFRFNYTWNEARAQAILDNFGGAVPFDLSSIRDASGQSTPGVDFLQIILAFGGQGVLTLQDQRDVQHQKNFVDTLSYSLGRHSLKVGV